MARQLGADEIVNLTEVDPMDAVIELTGGERPVERFGARGGNADVVIDSAGAKASPNQGLTMLNNKMVASFPSHYLKINPNSISIRWCGSR